MKSYALPIAAMLVLAGCSAGQPRGSSSAFARSLKPLANPGQVVANDLTFAREARTSGIAAAVSGNAASTAAARVANSEFAAERWLLNSRGSWSPKLSWSSCDGTVAVTTGVFSSVQGGWGRYATVWERDRDGPYYFTYSFGLPDAALTRSRQKSTTDPAASPNDIVVDGDELIEGKIADCDTPPRPIPVDPVQAGKAGGADGAANDRTLRWSAQFQADGISTFTVSAWTANGWENVQRIPLASPAGAQR